jgi:Spy/CpxP family protein refolding chaperone
MPTRRANPRYWFSIAMIVVGFAILVVVSLSAIGPGYFGPGMHTKYGHGMYAHPYERYGYPMAGGEPMGGAWKGSYGMFFPGPMMLDINMMPGVEAMRGLNLTQDQLARIESVQSQAEEKRWNLLESLRAESEKLEALLLRDGIETGALSEQYTLCAQLRRRIFDLGVKERQQVDQILTDAQRRQWHRWQRDYIDQ